MNFYDLLEKLVTKSTCSETEKRDMLSVIQGMRDANSFGNAAVQNRQTHTCIVVKSTGKCAHCNRQMQMPELPKPNRYW